MNPAGPNTYPALPRVGVGAIVISEGRILLSKEAWPGPRLWAIPGGTLKLGETMQAARPGNPRGNGVTIAVGECIYVFDQLNATSRERSGFILVVVDFAALYVSGEPRGADDADEARWFAPEELAHYPVSQNTLKALAAVGYLN